MNRTIKKIVSIILIMSIIAPLLPTGWVVKAEEDVKFEDVVGDVEIPIERVTSTLKCIETDGDVEDEWFSSGYDFYGNGKCFSTRDDVNFNKGDQITWDDVGQIGRILDMTEGENFYANALRSIFPEYGFPLISGDPAPDKANINDEYGVDDIYVWKFSSIMKGQGCMWACLYDDEDYCYNYVALSINRQATKAISDNVSIIGFKSRTLFFPLNICTAKDDDSVKIYYGAAGAAGWLSTIINNFMENDYTDEDIGKAIDDMLVVEPLSKNGNIVGVSLYLNAKTCNPLIDKDMNVVELKEPNEKDNTDGDFTIRVSRNKRAGAASNLTYTYESSHEEPSNSDKMASTLGKNVYVGSFVFTKGYLDFGESNEIKIGKEVVNSSAGDTETIMGLVENIISTFTTNIMNSVTTQEEIENITAEYLMEHATKSKDINKIIEIYAEVMAQRIREYKLADYFSNYDKNDILKDCSDPYEIMNRIIYLNIRYMQGIDDQGYGDYSSTWWLTGMVDDSGKQIVVHPPAGSSVANVPARAKKDTLYTHWSIKQVWGKLTGAQKSILAATYVQQMDRWTGRFSTDVAVIDEDTEAAKALYTILNEGAISSNAKETPALMMPDDPLNPSSVEESMANHVLETMDKWRQLGEINETNSVLNIIRWCDFIGEYIVFTGTYGEITAADLVDEEGNKVDWMANSSYNIYDERLASLSKRVTIHEENELYWPISMPRCMTLFGKEGNQFRAMVTTEAADGYSGSQFDKLINFLYNVAYGFDICCFSEAGKESGYTPLAVYNALHAVSGQTDKVISDDAWAEKERWDELAKNNSAPTLDWVNQDYEATNFNSDTTSMDMCRSIIQLHKLCTFLGIGKDDWTGAIHDFLLLYETFEDEFKALEKNPNLFVQTTVEGTASYVEPMGLFFSLEKETVSDQWMRGFALSSLYVPMQTNVYNASTVTYLDDSDWVASYYYRFAFYRKALNINTDSNAIVNKFVSGETSGTMIATLGDLLNYDRDIILTIDDTLYNADRADDVISKLDYMSVRNTGSANQESEDFLQNITGGIEDLVDLDTPTVLKTGGVHYYSHTLASNVTPLDEAKSSDKNIINSVKTRYLDAYLLGSDAILETFDETKGEYEYTIKTPLAVISAIYRSNDLYNTTLRAENADTAIFKSSKAICATPGTDYDDWYPIYNYYMLANLAAQMKNDTASTLDLDAPIFVDLFGNILTESGLVIIPAAANSTILQNDWSPCNAAFATYYYHGNMIEDEIFDDEFYEWLTGLSIGDTIRVTESQIGVSDEIVVYERTWQVDKNNGPSKRHEQGGGWFTYDNKSGNYILRTTEISAGGVNALVQWDQLNKNAQNVKNVFYNKAYFDVGETIGKNNFLRIVNLTEEVLRGAPIEYISYENEGISGKQDISKYGVWMAYKLDELSKSVINGQIGSETGNSMITMPNLAFMPGVEYIVLYVFKICFALMIFGLAISLYLDATRNSLGIKSVGKFIFTCMMVIVAITLVPNIITWSYYNANKHLLKDEMSYVMLLNYAKEFDGAEVGITSIETPETNTELFLKLDDVSIDWWNAIYPVLFTNTFNTVTELYQNQLVDNNMALEENVILKADGLYMDVMDIYNSTNMTYLPTQQKYMNYRYSSTGFEAVSFVTPYYLILDQLINNINSYNTANAVDSYDYSVGSNGHVVTYGVISPYLCSAEFLEDGYDTLNFYRLFETPLQFISYEQPYSDETKERMKLSEWWPDDSLSDEILEDKIADVYLYMRDWVNQNRTILGKVPDEVFLKVLALETATEFNQIFGVPDGNSIEIINVDTRDVLRLMIGDRADVYKYYSYSFARYTYELAGGLGVILAAFLIGLLWLTSILKPVLMIALVALLIINAIGRKVLFRKESRCIEGYLISCAALALSNYLYAIMLKLSIQMSGLGFTSVGAMVLGVVIQVVYTILLILICWLVVKDWSNMGFNEYQSIAAAITAGITNTKSMLVDKLVTKNNSIYRESRANNRIGYDSRRSGSEQLEDAFERDRMREENAMNDPTSVAERFANSTFN